MTKKRINKTNKSRRKFIKTTAALTAASSIPLFNINHVWAQDVVFRWRTF